MDRLKAFFASDLFFSFSRSPSVVLAATVTFVLVFSAAFSPILAPHDPFDQTQIDLLDSHLPPAWEPDGEPRFLLGTDNLGRDIFSTILYGSRISLMVGFLSVILAVVLGTFLGLLSGYLGGVLDAVIMRIAEIQLTIPAILFALLVDGVLRSFFPSDHSADVAILVLVLSIGISGWVQYARTVRGSTLVEKNKEYVQAAKLLGIHPLLIMTRHVLPNVLGPVLVLATVHLSVAIITEATLSFLGVGLPPNEPSLGTLIRIGNDFLFSGEWWITIFPGITLAGLVLSVNLLGDWLRDALNPKLKRR